MERAALCLLDGRCSWSTPAPEATRLGLGAKYLINPRLDLCGE